MNTQKSSFSSLRIVFAAMLILVGVATRVFLKDVPNVETITAVSIVAGGLLGGAWSMLVGLLVVAGSDMLIGNTAILYYTWSAWAVVGLFGLFVKTSRKKPSRWVLALTGAGLASNLFFFAWTNFGVWHIGGLYPHTAQGLVDAYIMGLPFLRAQLISTVVFVPFVSSVALWVWNRAPQWQHFLVSRGATADNNQAQQVR